MSLAQSLGLRFRGVVVPNGVEVQMPTDRINSANDSLAIGPRRAEKRSSSFWAG